MRVGVHQREVGAVQADKAEGGIGLLADGLHASRARLGILGILDISGSAASSGCKGDERLEPIETASAWAVKSQATRADANFRSKQKIQPRADGSSVQVRGRLLLDTVPTGW